ncbi:MAG TPA: hypothetical protein VIF62_31925 [Labilithrix sp.]|jgi:hypothetical protein
MTSTRPIAFGVALGAAVFASSTIASAEPRAKTDQGGAAGTTQTTSAEYTNVVTDEGVSTFRPNRPLLFTGAALVAFPYLAGVGVAFKNNPHADEQLFVPIAGPWMDLEARPCMMGPSCTARENVASTLVVASGVVQATGLVLALASFVIPEKDKPKPTATADVHVAPVSFASGAGVGAAGVF